MYETPQTQQLLLDLIKKYGVREVINKLSMACGYTREEVKKKIAAIKNRG